jgi:hypothetical protein
MLWAINGVAIASGAHDERSPEITSDGAGGAIIVWEDDRSADSDTDIYAQRVNASGVLLWASGGIPITTDGGKSSQLDMDSDGFGGAIVSWTNTVGADSDIYAQRVNASGALLWTLNGVVICATPEDQFRSAVASDGAGAGIFAWTDSRAGFLDDNIYAQSLNFLGTPLWTANGVAMTSASGDQNAVVIVSDDVGGVIASWLDNQSPGFILDIYAQRVDATGSMLWGANGTAVSTLSGNQTFQKIVSDGSSGAVIVWQDQRNAGVYDIYAQNVNFLGTGTWGANGVAVCTAMDHQTNPDIVRNSSGEYTVAWVDFRNDSLKSDIYAQLLNTAGTVQWATNGVIITTATNSQSNPLLAAAGSGAIVSWEDARVFGDTDIYMNRIASSGVTGIKVNAPLPSITLSTNSPNPFSAFTLFEIELEQATTVIIDVFDVTGRRVHSETRRLFAGLEQLRFDGRGFGGRPLPAGVYFYQVVDGKQTFTRKMVLVR